MSKLSLILAVVLAGSVVLHVCSFLFARSLFERYCETLLNPAGLNDYPAAAPGPPDAASPKLRVVFFGDSRAEMWPAPATPSGSNVEYINRGIGSQTTAQMLLRFDAHVASLHPSVVVVQAGMNDLRAVGVLPRQRDAIVATCKEHLREIVARSRRAGARVVASTIFGINEVPLQWRPFWSAEISHAIDEVNRDLRTLAGPGVSVLDAATLLADPADPTKVAIPYRFGMDHLNAAGYGVLNRALMEIETH